VAVAALVALIASVAALDSLNPSTVAPALVLAIGRRPLLDVAAFTAGVLCVSTAGGLVLLFGPGRQLLARVARPSPHTQHLVETASGIVLIAIAVALWLLRRQVARGLMRTTERRGGGSAFALGAGIMAIELPTAFPYFAGLVAIVASRRSAVAEAVLVLLYNALFVGPLLVILAVVAVEGRSAAPLARRARSLLDAYGPVLAPATLGAIGIVLVAIGGSRL
jgi:cytochrome c biogenesis protein CcdA